MRGRQGANGMALGTVLPAVSPIPSLMFILFVYSYLCLPILHWIAPPSRTPVWDPSKGAPLRVLRPDQWASRPPKASKGRGTLMVGHQIPWPVTQKRTQLIIA